MANDDTVKRPERDERGRLLPGHKSPGPGRPALPDAFKAKGQAMLEGIAAIAEDKEHPDRLKALTWCAERIYGKAPQAVDITGSGDLVPAAAALLQLAKERSGEEKKEGEK